VGGKAIMPSVVSFLAQHAGEPIALPQLAAGLGVAAGPIQKALSNAINSGVYGASLQCVHRGQVWVWNGTGHAAPVAPTPLAAAPPAAPPVAPAPVAPVKPEGLAKGDVVEVIGLTQDGQAVARDENGQLYRVVPL